MRSSGSLLTSIPLLEFGAQFAEAELHLPASVDDVCEEEILSSDSTDVDSDAANQASSVSGGPLQRLYNTQISEYQMDLDTEHLTADVDIGGIELGEQSAKAARSNHIPSILISDHTAQCSSGASKLSPGNSSMTAESIAAQAYDVFLYLNERWAEKLRATPSLRVMCITHTPKSLFAFGARTLQNLYKNILPETFDQVFALMHIAFVFQHVIDVQVHSHDWMNSCHDVYMWQQVLSDPHEAELFDEVWSRLWSPQVSIETSLFKNSNFVTSLIVNMPPEISEPATVIENFGVLDDRTRRYYPSTLPFEKPSSKKLFKGTIIRGCSRFLDGSS